MASVATSTTSIVTTTDAAESGAVSRKSASERRESASERREEKLSAAQAARAERQRLRARELRAARLAARPAPTAAAADRQVVCAGERLLDTGGGFLLAADSAPAAAPRPAPAPSAPPPLRAEWPRCEECGTQFPTSWLLDTFSYAACDACRDPEPEGRHALVARTQGKHDYLLQDCDLDLRDPPLRCLRRRNPHRAAGYGASADMRLYLRLQLRQRAELVWGSLERLEERRQEREQRREHQASKKYVKELRALRMEARGTVYTQGVGAEGHVHEWGEECSEGEDMYSRVCTTCGLHQTYEKM